MAEPDDLGRLTSTIAHFVAELPERPRLVRVRSGDVDVEVEWAHADGAVPAKVPKDRPAPDPARVPAPAGAPAPAAGDGGSAPAPAGGLEEYVRSPSVGVFYHAETPGAAPFVRVGDAVRPAQQVGIVEAMKLMIPVEATRSGRITRLLKDDGEPVEYDEPLFAVEPLDGR